MKKQEIIIHGYPVRKYLEFLSFLALTVMLWLMNKLSQDYDTVLKVSPKLNSSLAGIYSEAADNTLYVQVRASGFFILSKKFSDDGSFAFDINDYPDEQHTIKIPTTNLKDRIRDYFDKNVQILSIEPDTVYYNMSEYVTKKIAVTGNFELSFKREFRQSAPVQFLPDSVIIAGARDYVAQVKSIALLPQEYDDVDETIEDISNIATAQDIYVNPSKIRYRIPVERCTEGSVAVMIRTVNVPQNNRLILLPAKVNVRYVVPLRDYQSVSVNDFCVEVDFDDTQMSLNRHIKVKVVRHPSSVFDIRLEPAFVEFLIQNNHD
jgi:YbbR domain-containing protein